MTYLVHVADFDGGVDGEGNTARGVFLHASVVHGLRELRRVVVDVVHGDGHLGRGVGLSASHLPDLITSDACVSVNTK